MTYTKFSAIKNLNLNLNLLIKCYHSMGHAFQGENFNVFVNRKEWPGKLLCKALTKTCLNDGSCGQREVTLDYEIYKIQRR